MSSKTAGTQLKRGTTAIASVRSINGTGFEVATREVTHLGSVTKEYKPSPVPGALPITISIFYDKLATTHAQLLTDLMAGTISEWSIVFPPNDGVSPATPDPVVFNAFASKFTFDINEVDESIQGELTLQPTGSMAFAETP